MTRSTRVSAWAACLAFAGLATLAACTPPEHAAVLKCQGANRFEVAVRKQCDVSIARFEKRTAATVPVDTRHRRGHVRGSFSVAQGSARIVLHGTGGPEAEVTVSPGNPGSLEGQVRLDRKDPDFRLRFFPEGEVLGLTGTVLFEAR